MNAAEKQEKRKIILPGTSNTPGDWAVTDDRWVKEKQHWTDTTAGKAGIEFVSRLMLGSIFYSLMENSKSMKRMETYRSGTHLEKKAKGETTFLENISHFLDKTVTKAVYNISDKFFFRGAIAKEVIVDADGKKHTRTLKDAEGNEVTKARKFIRFRENKNIHTDQKIPGRSLGAEMTVVTASFAAMSAGTAIMRNILSGALNPKERASWSKNGKFDPLHIAKRVVQKTWEIGTYNAGEDMAVALPYVFYMRGQRNIIDKAFRGFKYSSDGVDNGGGYRIGDNGKVQNHMIWAGAADLQGRFTVYNIFTQLYRDVYNLIGNNITQWWKDGKSLKAPEWLKHPEKMPTALISGTKSVVRYTTVSTIRSLIQMTPVVPFFSSFRVSGSKAKGMVVHSDHGALHFVDTDKSGKETLGNPIRTDLGGYYYKGDFVGHDHRYNYGTKPKMRFADGTDFNKKSSFFYRNDKDKNQFDPNGFGDRGRKLHESPTVRVTDKIARFMHKTAESDAWLKYSEGMFKIAGYKGDDKNMQFTRRRLAKDAMMAGIPYAAYFAAKVAAREAYVNDQMNMAVERFVDGLIGLDGKEIAAGMGEISNTVMRQPIENPERAASLIERHIRNPSDRSPRPTGWSADLHKESVAHVKGGEDFESKKVIARLNKERSEYFSKNAKRNNIDLKKTPAQNWTDKNLETSEVTPPTHLS